QEKNNTHNPESRYPRAPGGSSRPGHRSPESSGRDWACIGTGRQDNKTKGEYNPIFYKKKEWTVRESRMFWLSDTPDKIGSISWGVTVPRVCTMALFHHAADNRSFIVANTHLDHTSELARANGAKLIIARMTALRQRWQGAGPIPVFIMGDFSQGPVRNGGYEPLYSSKHYDLSTDFADFFDIATAGPNATSRFP
ncbi:hypothetical protein B0T16DRAFT_506373, partial [Cercophora newfieldiana]